MNELSSEILRLDERGVCELRIPGEKSLNILTEAALDELIAILKALASKDLRAVVVRGRSERAFAGGADIKRMATLDPQTARAFIRRIGDACDALRAIAVPTIAFIEGFCLGAGMELAAACDVRIASTSAQFGMPEVRIGIPSVVHACLLPRQIGPGAANWLLMTGEVVGCAQMEKWGFLQFCESGAALQGALDRTLDAIVASGPNAVRTQKRLLLLWEESSVGDGVAASVDEFAGAFTDDEAKRYMAPFLTRISKGSKS